LALTRSYQYEVELPAVVNNDEAGNDNGDEAKEKKAADDDDANNNVESKTTASVAVGSIYPIGNFRRAQHVTADQLDQVIDKAVEKAAASSSGNDDQSTTTTTTTSGGEQAKRKPQPTKKAKKQRKATLRDALIDALDVGPRLVTHCIVSAGLAPKAAPADATPSHRAALLTALGAIEAELERIKVGMRARPLVSMCRRSPRMCVVARSRLQRLYCDEQRRDVRTILADAAGAVRGA
jgi:hypothetical protein